MCFVGERSSAPGRAHRLLLPHGVIVRDQRHRWTPVRKCRQRPDCEIASSQGVSVVKKVPAETNTSGHSATSDIGQWKDKLQRLFQAAQATVKRSPPEKTDNAKDGGITAEGEVDNDEAVQMLNAKDVALRARTISISAATSIGVAILGAEGLQWWLRAPDSLQDAAAQAAESVGEAAYASEAAAADAVGDILAQSEARDSHDPATDVPTPEVPGLGDCNVRMRLPIPGQDAEAFQTHEAGIRQMMARPMGAILGTMAQEGWKVTCIDESTDLFEMSLPAVRYALPLGVVTIPPPCFRTQLYPSTMRAKSYQERLFADMVLQNGKGICSVDLGFPFHQKFSITVAGKARARVGQVGGKSRLSVDVDCGLRIPTVPGLRSLMEVFVRNYLTESVNECSRAVANGADAQYIATTDADLKPEEDRQNTVEVLPQALIQKPSETSVDSMAWFGKEETRSEESWPNQMVTVAGGFFFFMMFALLNLFPSIDL